MRIHVLCLIRSAASKNQKGKFPQPEESENQKELTIAIDIPDSVQNMVDTEIPEEYTVNRNYEAIQKIWQEVPQKEKHRIMFIGPKGSGKSLTLITLWYEFSRTCKVIFLGVDIAENYFNSPSVAKYLQEALGIHEVQSKEQLLYAIEEGLKQSKFDIVFLDLSLQQSSEQFAIQLVRLCCNFAPNCVIAMSSGSGKQFSSNNKTRLKTYTTRFTPVDFKPFTKEEAVVFLNSTCHIKDFSAERFLKQLKALQDVIPICSMQLSKVLT